MADTYELQLPVFKQGDDLSGQLRDHKDNVPEALHAQAACYEEAARLCLRLAEVAQKVPLQIDADTHMIVVEGPKEALDLLVKEEILSTMDYDEDYDEDILDEEIDEDEVTKGPEIP